MVMMEEGRSTADKEGCLLSVGLKNELVTAKASDRSVPTFR